MKLNLHRVNVGDGDPLSMPPLKRGRLPVVQSDLFVYDHNNKVLILFNCCIEVAFLTLLNRFWIFFTLE